MAKMFKRSATIKGGSGGRLKSESGAIDLKLSKAAEVGGEEPFASNPVELFAAGYASCLASAIEFILHQEGSEFEEIHVKAVAGLLTDSENGGFKMDIELEADITGVPAEAKETFIRKGYEFCPFTKATGGNIDSKLKVIQ